MEAQEHPMEAQDIKAMQRELYEAGEYHALSMVLEPAAEILVATARVCRGDTVLDVAAGDGNVAIAAGRREARVVACDLSELQVQRGRQRCLDASIDVSWLVADAEQLPFDDDQFDCVLSAFGVVAAPDSDTATSELFRVCRSGGTVGLTAWARGSYMAELTSALADLLGADLIPDRDNGWGADDVLLARLERHGIRPAIRRESLKWDPAARSSAGSADCAAAFLRARISAQQLDQAAATRTAVERRFRTPDGMIVGEYVVATAQAR